MVSVIYTKELNSGGTRRKTNYFSMCSDEGQSLSNLIDITKLPQESFNLIMEDLLILIQPCSTMDLLKMSPQPELTLWQPYRSQSVNQFLLKSLVHRHGSNFLHNTKCLRVITSYLRIFSATLLNK